MEKDNTDNKIPTLPEDSHIPDTGDQALLSSLHFPALNLHSGTCQMDFITPEGFLLPNLLLLAMTIVQGKQFLTLSSLLQQPWLAAALHSSSACTAVR